jgi:hypothetical protein
MNPFMIPAHNVRQYTDIHECSRAQVTYIAKHWAVTCTHFLNEEQASELDVSWLYPAPHVGQELTIRRWDIPLGLAVSVVWFDRGYVKHTPGVVSAVLNLNEYAVHCASLQYDISAAKGLSGALVWDGRRAAGMVVGTQMGVAGILWVTNLCSTWQQLKKTLRPTEHTVLHSM